MRRATSFKGGLGLGVEIGQVAVSINGSEEGGGEGALNHAPNHPKILKIDLFLDITKQCNFYLDKYCLYCLLSHNETKSDDFSEIVVPF